MDLATYLSGLVMWSNWRKIVQNGIRLKTEDKETCVKADIKVEWYKKKKRTNMERRD